MRAFVTGGGGFLGRRVVRALAEGGADVVCLIRPTSETGELEAFVGSSLWPRVGVVRGELADPASYRDEVRRADVVYHLAAGLTGGPSILFASTVIPTRMFARTCAEEKVARFVLVSSFGVYGAGGLATGSILDETCPVDPNPQLRDPYTFSKIIQEQVCREFEPGLRLVVVRPGVIFGPGRGALSSRVGLSLGGLTFRIGHSRQLPYTYVDNCAEAIRLAGIVPGIEGETFNILDDDLPTVGGVLRAYRTCGKRLKSVWLPQASIGPLSGAYEAYHRYSKGQLPNVLTRYRTATFWRPLRFSNAKAKARLNWRPAVPMARALELAITSSSPQAS